MKRIDLLCSTRRPEVTQGTINWWQSKGWEVKTWYNDGYPCGTGRNKMLEEFYASDRQWIVIADDDITLYTHRYNTQWFLDKPELWQNQTEVDYFSLNSNNEMHRQMMKSWWDKNEFNQQLVFKRDMTPTKIHIFRKPPKPLWFEKWYGYEDYDFALQFINEGMTVARLLNVFLREQGFSKSSLFEGQEHRKECYAQARIELENKWGNVLIQVLKNKWVPRGMWHNHPRYDWICCESNQNKMFATLFDVDAE